MKKIILFLLLCNFTLIGLYSEDSKTEKSGLEINLRQLSLNLNSTNVNNSNSNFSSSRLNTDSEMNVDGKLDFITNYFFKKFLWSSSILSEYGKTYIKPVNKEKYETENIDKILLNTDLTLRIWKFENLLGGFESGPFVSLEYETEFNKNKNSDDTEQNLRKILRSKLGFKVFEGKYLKNLYLAYIAEEDYTYETKSSKTGYETGYNLLFDIRDGIKFINFLKFRDYLSRTKENLSDIHYELEMELRLDVKLFNKFSMSPFINYYKSSLKSLHISADNWYTGISLSYSNILKKIN